MIVQEIEMDGPSLETARERIKANIPAGFEQLEETILSDGLPQTIQGSGETIELAFAKAQASLAPTAEIIQKREVMGPGVKIEVMEAFDEQSVRAKVTHLRSIRVVRIGKKGGWGLGKTPNQYELEVFQPAVCEIVYQDKPRIRVKIGKKETCPLCGGTGLSDTNCPSCGGMGWLGGGASYSTLGDRCPDCIQGKEPCRDCSGAGKI